MCFRKRTGRQKCTEMDTPFSKEKRSFYQQAAAQEPRGRVYSEAYQPSTQTRTCFLLFAGDTSSPLHSGLGRRPAISHRLWNVIKSGHVIRAINNINL